MQTLYYTTEHFVRHTSDIVDFTRYKAALERTEERPVSASRTLWPENRPADRCARKRKARMLLRTIYRGADFAAAVSLILFALTFFICFFSR